MSASVITLEEVQVGEKFFPVSDFVPARDFVQLLLAEKAENRPSARDILAHPFIKQFSSAPPTPLPSSSSAAGSPGAHESLMAAVVRNDVGGPPAPPAAFAGQLSPVDFAEIDFNSG